MGRFLVYLRSTVLLFFTYFNICLITADIPAAPVNVTVRHLQANSAVVSWEVADGDAVIGYAISQQKKDVRMLRLIQEVNTTSRSCVLWDLEENTEYIVHVQSIGLSGVSPVSDPITFRTPKEAEKSASKASYSWNMLLVCHQRRIAGGAPLHIQRGGPGVSTTLPTNDWCVWKDLQVDTQPV
ncbi:fibronectin type III domain-containing protein 5 isoform X3 [Scyliorhinus canicula]|uniref:fibronectin type III domain-containing protein 5 isoform X3 n=1 Tax=Scyliorhinus canicula TaxID=7830 RepID=UPI0018F7132C|nr:fibronectin type III domain-containing protein 5 isoform X3 [Scyliorhinus canicula]